MDILNSAVSKDVSSHGHVVEGEMAMDNISMKQIQFVCKNRAELCDTGMQPPSAGEVAVMMHFTAISAGTERALLTQDDNVGIDRNQARPFPRVSGYSGSGVVCAVGDGVTDLVPGDRVITYWGNHAQINVLPRSNVVKIPYENVSLKEAAFIFISTFSLAAVRKVHPELGESAMVVGLGPLGLLAVQYAKIAGAIPVIAVDPNPQRRDLAKQLGADFALDYADSRVQDLTGGKGVDTIIEVTGNGDALNQALYCAAKFARVALLGCTRKPTTIDLYHDVHGPGISIIGAHTDARPKLESRPGYWTHEDDCKAALRYLAAGKLNIGAMIAEIHSPKDAPEVYTRLISDRYFPIGVAFDWNLL